MRFLEALGSICLSGRKNLGLFLLWFFNLFLLTVVSLGHNETGY
jgi:hypothetical protein